MLLFCPRCQTSAPAGDRCPGCHGRLVTPAEAHASAPDLHAAPPPDPVRPTPAGRLVVGVAAGLGLFFGLREWGTAGLSAAGEGWRTPAGLAAAGTLKVLAAGVAGLLAGTGRTRGAQPGLTAGLVVAGLLLAAELQGGGKAELSDLATAVGLVLAAAAGGAVGSWRWPAPVDLPPPPSPQGSSLAALVSRPLVASEKPLRWYRVVVGGLIAAAGIALADPARDICKRGAAGTVGGTGASLATVVDLEIAALAVMLGGALAGATTGVGTRHGMLAGVVGGLATVWMPAAGVKSVFPVVEGLLKVLGLPTGDLAGPGAAFNLLLAILTVAAFGGWLGGTLLPPVVARDKVKRRLVEA